MNFNASMFERFLARFRPGGPWMIYARSLDEKGAMLCKVFDDVKEASAWAAVMNSEQNPHQIYFQINPTDKRKKPKDVDITRVEWFQVDIDPWKGETAKEAFDRISDLLTRGFPRQVKPPTLVVFSGGGFQAYWRLEDPVCLDGSKGMIDDLKGYNRALAALLDGDNCWDLCRVFRAPGTVNWPNEKKRKRGQKPQLAEVQFWEDDRAYDVTDFVKADSRPQVEGSHVVDVPDDVPTVDLDDLAEHRIPEKCLDVIVNGPGPEHSSRSEAVWYVACELVRRGVPDAMVYGILSNPMFEISEHVLAQNDPRRCAVRHIERAHEYAEDPDLAEMNERYAVISNYGGKCLVMYERHNFELDRTEVAMQSKNHFFDATAQLPPVKVGDGKDTKYLPRARWWWVQEKRRQYESVVFAPGRETPPEYYNLFKGFAYEPTEGRCDLFLDHVRDNLCQGNADHYRYLVGWMARAVQVPGEPAQTAVVLQGDPGTGKSFFATHFGALFGRHFVPITDSKHLLGSFNAHLQDCIVLFADEAFSSRDTAAVSRLKGRITEPTLTIEKKGIDAVPSQNCLHIIMASNEQWVVPVEHGDRRFFVLEMGVEHQRDAKYFGAIATQLEEGGYGALLRFLQDYDLSGYDVRDIPWSEALRKQKICTMEGAPQWWFDVLCRGCIAEGETWPKKVPASHLQWDYYQFSDVHRQTKAIATVVGMFLAKALPKLDRARVRRSHEAYRIDGEKYVKELDYWYRLPPLDECRAHFDRKFGGPYEWPDVTTIDVVEDTEEAY